MNYSTYQKSINQFIKEYTFKQIIVVLSLSLVLSSISYQFFDLFSAIGFVVGAITLLLVGILNTLFAKYFSNYFFSIVNNPKNNLNELFLTSFVEVILSILLSTIALLLFYSLTSNNHALILFGLGASLVSVFFHLGGAIYSGSLNLGYKRLLPSDLKIHKEDIRILKINSLVISRSLSTSSFLTDFTLSNLFILVSLIFLGLIKLPLITNNNYTLFLILVSFYALGVLMFQYMTRKELYRLINLSLSDLITDIKLLKGFKKFSIKTRVNVSNAFILIKMFSLLFITVVFYQKVSSSQNLISVIELIGLVIGGLLVFVYLYIFTTLLHNLSNQFTVNTFKQLKRLLKINHKGERLNLNNTLSSMIFKNQQKLIIPILITLTLIFIMQSFIGISFLFGVLVGVTFGSILISLLLEYNQNSIAESKVEFRNPLNLLPSNAMHSVLELMILISLLFSRVYR